MKTKRDKMIDKISIITEIDILTALWRDIKNSYDVKNNRQRRNVRYRSATMVAMRKHGNLSLHDIGKIFERDHATVIHSQNKHEVDYNYDKEYRAIYQAIEEHIIKTLDAYDLRNFDLPQLHADNSNRNEVIDEYKEKIVELEDKVKGLVQDNIEAKKMQNFYQKQHEYLKERYDNLNEMYQKLKSRTLV